MFTSQSLTVSGASCTWPIGLYHGDMSEANTLTGGLALGLGLGKWGTADSRLETGLALTVGSSPATSFMSHTIALSSELTLLPGSTSRVADAGFGLLHGEAIATLKSRMRQLQEENKALEDRLAELTGRVDTTAVETDAILNIAEQEVQHVEYCREMECLALDTITLQRMLDNLRANALELKAKYDIKRGIRLLLEAGIAAMKKEITMTSRLQLKLQAKRASLREELYIITKSLHKMKDKQGAFVTLLGPLMCTETEITACKMKLQTLLKQLHDLIGVNRNLKRTLAEARFQANSVISGYQTQIARLEAAIKAAKRDLQEHIISHKEVQDLKQSLGAEIATYWTLLDGEELSIPIQINRSSSPVYLSESLPDSSRTSSPCNPVQADIAVKAQPEETEKNKASV